MILNELAASLNVFAHQHAEHALGFGRLLQGDSQQHATGGIQRRFPELLGIHLAKAFEALALNPLLVDSVDPGKN